MFFSQFFVAKKYAFAKRGAIEAIRFLVRHILKFLSVFKMRKFYNFLTSIG